MPGTLNANLAADKQVRKRLEEDHQFLSLVRRVRDDRKAFNQILMRHYNIWAAERDNSQSYHGRSRTYIATGRRVIENWVQKLKNDLFSSNEWFDVLPLRDSFEDRVEPLKSLFRYYFTKHMQLRRKATPFLRQLVTMGTSPVAVTWKQTSRLTPTLEDVLDAAGEPTGRSERKMEQLIEYLGPTFRVVDLFAFYAYPTTVMNLSDCTLIFEDSLVARDQFKQMARTPLSRSAELGNVVENAEEALKISSGDEARWTYERQRLAEKGFSLHVSDGKNANRPLDMSYCYLKADLDDTGRDWWRINLAGDTVPTLIQKNPFWHGQPPWLCGKFIEVVNEFYGRGLPETFDRLQYALTDTADQANDALTWCMNPIAIVDAYEVQDPSSIRMRPGARWLAKPDAVKFTEPPKETPQIGFQAVSQYIGLINDVSNVAAFSGSGPRLRGKATETATGAQIVQNENLVQVKDVVENIEDAVMVPLLRMSHILSMQCLTTPLILRIAGAAGSDIVEHKLTAADVVGDFDFQWLGSTATQNSQVRVSQMLNFLQLGSRIPPEVLQSQNIEIDFAYLLRSIWGEGMNLPHADRVIRDKVKQKTVDPRIENEIFSVGRGEEVLVSPGDDDDKHMAVHGQMLMEPGLDPAVGARIQLHIQQHQAAKQSKAILAQQQAQAQMMAQAQQASGGQPPGGGAGGGNGNGAAPGVPPANPGRMQQTSGLDDLMRQLPRGGQQ